MTPPRLESTESPVNRRILIIGCFETEALPQAPWWIGRGRNMGSRGRRAGVCGYLRGRRLRQANPDIHVEVLLRAAGAKRFTGILVAQAGQFIAAVDAVAISRRRGRFNRHQSHCLCPLLQDTTSAVRFAQYPAAKFRRVAMRLKRLLVGKGDRACRYFPAIRSKVWSAS
jgi:hypothetical protein